MDRGFPRKKRKEESVTSIMERLGGGCLEGETKEGERKMEKLRMKRREKGTKKTATPLVWPLNLLHTRSRKKRQEIKNET